MSSSLQTFLALAIVALAAGLLVWHFWRKRKQPGCGADCGAVSPELKKLQKRLKR
ncbi:MAG: FeoB-associated Cys-rich membrane protein [Opitutales bacterium]